MRNLNGCLEDWELEKIDFCFHLYLDMENYEFIIPRSPTTSKAAGLAGSYNNIHTTHSSSPSTLSAHSAIASSGGLVVGAIDIKQYLSREDVQELQEIGTQLRLGLIFLLLYSDI